MCPGSFLDLGIGGTDDGLDFSAVDETGYIGVGDLGGRKTRYTIMREEYSRRVSTLTRSLS